MTTELHATLATLERGTVEVISREELIQKLQKGKPLRIKAGFDPTAPDLHLGHVVLLQKLRQFQEAGHQILFLIGDFTARIGDPTGVSETRKVLTPEEIKANAVTYESQVFKILDRKKTQDQFNSEWLDQMTAMEFAGLGSKQTVARMLERDDFKKRFKENKDISILEFYYPLIQGYDSVHLQADVEIGGTDQKFNLLMGRTLQRRYAQEPQVVLTLPLLVGTDGHLKMSKSYGNAIGIQDSPKDQIGKIMSLSDELMWSYYELLSDLTSDAIKSLRSEVQKGTAHPKDVKMKLAVEIATKFHGPAVAQKAAEEFQEIFGNKGLPSDVEEVHFPKGGEGRPLVDLLVDKKLAPSKSEARRLIRQNAVTINDSKVSDTEFVLQASGESLIKVGKRRFLRVRFG